MKTNEDQSFTLIKMHDGTTMSIIHKGYRGFRAFSLASYLMGKLISLSTVIPDKIIHSPVFLFSGILACCMFLQQCGKADYADLSGSWGYRLDPLNAGVEEGWMHQEFGQKLQLPGTLAGNGIGEEVSVQTQWIGKIIDSAFWFDAKYEAYRSDGKYRVPFWLAPEKFYTGPAWYQREIVIPEGWRDKQLQLELELCHWFTDAWIDTVYLGQRNSLATPHRYTLPETILPGRYRLTLRIDNSYLIPMGINAHSVSDNTQGNWNGIVGEMTLASRPEVSIDDIQLYPDLASKSLQVRMKIGNYSGDAFSGTLTLSAASSNTGTAHQVQPVKKVVCIENGVKEYIYELNMGHDFLEWSEWSPAVYTLKATLAGEGAEFNAWETFGMSEFTTEGTGFRINGQPTFLRGTLECSIFPIEGHPPADVEKWKRIFSIIREYGLNHMRFHSWCPPEAAFEAADLLGIYLQVECGGWATQGLKLGDGTAMDDYIMEESKRIVREYGNHPSFCMMAYGNEADGENAASYLEEFVRYWKEKDQRRVYTSSAGWPVTDENQFFSTLQGRIQEWNERGSTYYIEDNPPTTAFDFENIIGNYAGPFVSHEPGQWCAFPDLKEIDHYTGVYKAGNFELFRAELEDKGMLHQAEDFLMASGRLQTLCYKAEIEAALRTRGLGGFQLLDLHDFPGQGTALVGALNAMWEEKGYTDAGEYRQFCDTTVILASIPSLVLTTDDTLEAEIEMVHFGSKPLPPGIIHWEIIGNNGKQVAVGHFAYEPDGQLNRKTVGIIQHFFQQTDTPSMYRLDLNLAGSGHIANSWDIFVFPEILPDSDLAADIHYCKTLDKEALQVLRKGGTVWLDVYDGLNDAYAAKTGFTPVYWNTLTFNSQAIHTMGVLCDPDQPLFNKFPTQMHTNWQWWDIVTNAKAMILDQYDGIMPLVQMIDSYHSNRKLGLIFEAKCGNGKLLVSSFDLSSNIDGRPATRQMKYAIEKYLLSADFNPVWEVNPNGIDMLTE